MPTHFSVVMINAKEQIFELNQRDIFANYF
jgi:hypothetical protein